MKNLYFTISLLMIMIFMGCESHTPIFLKNIEFTKITRGHIENIFVKNFNPLNYVIKNQKQWDQLIDRMDSKFGSSINKEYFRQFAIDFSKHWLLAVYSIHHHGEGDTEIQSVTEYSNSVNVAICSRSYDFGIHRTSFHLVSIPIVEQEVRFERLSYEDCPVSPID